MLLFSATTSIRPRPAPTSVRTADPAAPRVLFRTFTLETVLAVAKGATCNTAMALLLVAAKVAAGMGAPPAQLLPSERLILLEIAVGKTLAQVSEAVNYSERHVRRLLRSVLVKASTADRAEALEFFASQLDSDAA